MQWFMWKTKFLETSSEGLFRTLSNRISHCIHIIRTSGSQLSTKFGILYLQVEVVPWPCSLKYAYSMIDLAFLRTIVTVKHLAKFCLHSFGWFCHQISCDTKYFFLSCPRHCDWGSIVIESILFSNQKLKRKQDYY